MIVDIGEVDFQSEVEPDREMPENVLFLPSQFEVYEWKIMADFMSSLKAGKIQNELSDAIHGKGAFRMFKSAIRRHHLEDSWDKFRVEALEETAREWCEENEISFS
jgi:hypothetical protein